MKGYKFTLFFGFIAFLAIGCADQGKKNEMLIRKVKVAAVQNKSTIEQKDFSGIVKEARSVKLSFRVAGPIKKLNINEGSFVKKGDVIGEIDTRDYALQLAVAQADYEKVTSETNRVSELYKRNGVTELEYQKAIAGEKMITQQLNHAKHQMNDTKLVAPFSGYIQSVNFGEGEIVNIGMPIASLLDMNSYRVEVDIPASLFVSRGKFTDFTCKLNFNGSKEIPLKLLYTHAKANSSQLYRLVFELNSKIDERVAPGMEVGVLIKYDLSSKQRCFVPLDAVFNSAGKTYVWGLNPADTTVSKIEVVLGELTDSGNILILSGLQGNETIVVAGVNVLNEGEKVEMIKPASETNIGGLL